MSERPSIVDRVPFDIEDRLGRRELNQLEGAIRDEITVRDETLSGLQEQNLTIRTERDALKRRIETIEQERLDLTERIEELETDRLRFDPEGVVADFGAALDAATEERRYAVTDFQVDLRANVVTTDDGIRLQLPTPREDVDARNLSTLRFAVSRQPDAGTADYREVPALVGLGLATAEEHLAERGLAVGELETEAAADADVVLGQFPDPYVLAEPGSEVDLVVSVVPDSEASGELEGREPDESGPDGPDGDGSAAEEAELRAIDGIGPRRAERLRGERIGDIGTLLESDPERIADVAGVSTDQAAAWLVQARELR